MSNSGTIKNLVVRGKWQELLLSQENQGLATLSLYSGDTDVNVQLVARKRIYTSGFVGTNSGTISNCRCRVTYDGGRSQHGGMVGINRGTIENCINEGNINISILDTAQEMSYFTPVKPEVKLLKAEDNIESYVVGGIAATTDGGTIKNCTNEGNITVSVENANNIINRIDIILGGIVGTSTYGRNETEIAGCTNKGKLHGITTVDKPGFMQNISLFEENVTNCKNTGELTESWIIAGSRISTYIGGIKGFLDVQDNQVIGGVVDGMVVLKLVEDGINQVIKILNDLKSGDLTETRITEAVTKIDSIANGICYNGKYLTNKNDNIINVSAWADVSNNIRVPLPNLLSEAGLGLTGSSTVEDINSMVTTLEGKLTYLFVARDRIIQTVMIEEPDMDSSIIRDTD